MNYKNTFLFIFLVPFSIFGDGAVDTKYNIKERIQELNDELSKKLVRISDLGKTITERDEYIQSLRAAIVDFMAKVMRVKNFNEQEIKEFGQATEATITNFYRDLNEVLICKKTIKGFLLKELFRNDEEGQIDDFERIKFFVIKSLNEYRILKNLIAEYEELQQDVMNIDQELDDLKKL
jgi:predicted  nucleic acid-binding Zn-ribbon protein